MDFIPGLLKGYSRVIIGYPFDLAKLNIQRNRNKTFIEVFKTKSIFDLYKGVSMPIIYTPIKRSIQFSIFEKCNKMNFNTFASGFICGTVSTTMNIPYYYINNNYVLNNITIIKKTNIIQNLLPSYKTEFMRSCLSSTINLGIYGFLRNKTGNNPINTISNTIISAFITWTITYPFDTIRVLQQTRNTKYNIKFRKYLKNPAPLWKGISCVYLRIIPTSIISMLIYEQSRNIFTS